MTRKYKRKKRQEVVPRNEPADISSGARMILCIPIACVQVLICMIVCDVVIQQGHKCNR